MLIFSLHVHLVNTICAETEPRQGAPHYDVIMWPGGCSRNTASFSETLLFETMRPIMIGRISLVLVNRWRCSWCYKQKSLSLSLSLSGEMCPCHGINSRKPAVLWLTLQHGIDSMNQMLTVYMSCRLTLLTQTPCLAFSLHFLFLNKGARSDKFYVNEPQRCVRI